MCLAIPLKVTAIEGNTALVEQGGVSRSIRIDFIDDVQLGDFLLVHTGIAIQKVDPQGAESTLQIIRRIADEIH